MVNKPRKWSFSGPPRTNPTTFDPGVRAIRTTLLSIAFHLFNGKSKPSNLAH